MWVTRKRRLDAWPGAFAFQALDQAGLFAANVRPGTAMLVNVEVKILAENVLAEQIVRVSFVDGFLHDPKTAAVFVTEVDVRRAGPGRVASKDDAFQELVRIFLHEDAVVECSWLALVAVDAEKDLARMVLGQERPFEAAREAGTATTP